MKPKTLLLLGVLALLAFLAGPKTSVVVLATAPLIYAGPGKFYSGTTVQWPQAENGELKIGVNAESMDVANAMFGYLDATAGDVTIPIDFTPFDNWGALAFWYPVAFKTPAIGTQYGGTGTDVAGKVWTPDGRLYTVTSVLPYKPPELHLGNGIPLYGAAQAMGVVKSNTALGTAAAFYTLTTAQADPGGVMTLSDFVREPWTAAWGTVAGFGGDGGNALQAEEEFVVVPEIKLQAYKIQKLTTLYKLASVKYMVKCRPYGPTQAQIDAATLIQAAGGGLGRRYGAGGSAFTLTGSISGHTITLGNTNLVSAGYEFGGTKLGNGEIGFVNTATFTTGVVQPAIAFT